jgi:hypothetical protein
LTVNNGSSAVGAFMSAAGSDPPGLALSLASLMLPPPWGCVPSGVSVVREFAPGFYFGQ